MNSSSLLALAERWKTEADLLRRRGQEGAAVLLEGVARELEGEVSAWWLQALTPREAAEELGVTPDAVYKRIQRGDCESVGKPGAPRVPRYSLYGKDPPSGQEPDKDQNPSLATEMVVRRFEALDG